MRHRYFGHGSDRDDMGRRALIADWKRRGWIKSKGSKKRWIQHALRHHKKGALHRQLRIPVGQKIPLAVLRRAAKAKGLLGQRARLALSLRRFRKRRRAS